MRKTALLSCPSSLSDGNSNYANNIKSSHSLCLTFVLHLNLVGNTNTKSFITHKQTTTLKF